MNRRSFLTSILATCVAPHFLRGGGRIWKTALNPAWRLAEFAVCYAGASELEAQSPHGEFVDSPLFGDDLEKLFYLTSEAMKGRAIRFKWL